MKYNVRVFARVQVESYRNGELRQAKAFESVEKANIFIRRIARYGYGIEAKRFEDFNAIYECDTNDRNYRVRIG